MKYVFMSSSLTLATTVTTRHSSPQSNNYYITSWIFMTFGAISLADSSFSRDRLTAVNGLRVLPVVLLFSVRWLLMISQFCFVPISDSIHPIFFIFFFKFSSTDNSDLKTVNRIKIHLIVFLNYLIN